MNISDARPRPNFGQLLAKLRSHPGVMFGVIMLVAILAFESFNYSTTDYALGDLLGGLEFAGLRWSTILAIAFCGIDFAGIARLFTPQQGAEEPKEVWYLFGAWLLAATMNAILTWWGVSMAITNHPVQSTSVLDAETVTKVVPVFVAVMVWIIRILIIGSFSVAGDRLLWGNNHRVPNSTTRRNIITPIASTLSSSASARPAATRPTPIEASSYRPEPTYHSVSMRPRPGGNSEDTTRV